jgi:FkbM family methyltransferase
MLIKNLIRSVLIFLQLDITQNLKYDRLTAKILKRVLKPGSNCIDVGCHKGEILKTLITRAPQGKHYAFEPIPYLFKGLQAHFSQTVTVLPYALSNTTGTTQFHLVKNAPAYSGIKKRRYDHAHPDIEIIEVEQKRLDDIIAPDTRIDLIKIDVEGGEFDVLKGGMQLLKHNKPTLIFECGNGASDFYGTQPEAIYQFLTVDIGLSVFTLQAFLKNHESLSQAGFAELFANGKEYYFVAYRVS